jgi:uncharacterized protein
VKLHAAAPSAAYSITGYGEGYVQVNGTRYSTSLVVLADRLIDWQPRSFAALGTADFEYLASLAADIVLLGTGARQRFPHPSLAAPLARANVGLEVMDVRAACRTYNILVAEERKVAAALLFE